MKKITYLIPYFDSIYINFQKCKLIYSDRKIDYRLLEDGVKVGCREGGSEELRRGPVNLGMVDILIIFIVVIVLQIKLSSCTLKYVQSIMSGVQFIIH